MLELKKIYINFMKREIKLEFIMPFPCWRKGKTIRRGWKYILWNGTCYKERSEICVLENVCILSQIFIGLDEIP
jgi:hypothetical protein